ncbi:MULTISPECIES: hypothetical protein [unclassified Streptomyces]|uniref:hypothetical protein n=1 Tax=unclassified Streptomyces TaxID=2593676 RepID=UPI002E2B72B9|nr:hypothetical protein [Streptomyces sp. NBC_00223]
MTAPSARSFVTDKRCEPPLPALSAVPQREVVLPNGLNPDALAQCFTKLRTKVDCLDHDALPRLHHRPSQLDRPP